MGTIVPIVIAATSPFRMAIERTAPCPWSIVIWSDATADSGIVAAARRMAQTKVRSR
jgi:hypothetical protein